MDGRKELCEGLTEGEQTAEQAEEMTVEAQEKTEDTGEKPEEGKSPKKKRGCLGCLGNIIIVVAVILLLMKGFEWLGHFTNPEANNEAAVKARTYDFFYCTCAGSFGGIFGKEGKVAFGKKVLPVLDKFMLEDGKSTVGNDEINTICTSEYTIDDEHTLAAYTGRKVKLTGKILDQTDARRRVQLVTDVNYLPELREEGVPEPPLISLDCNWVKEEPDKDDFVEVEGMLIVDPYDFSSEEQMNVFVVVKKIRKADYLELGGDPANLFMYQEMELVTSVEQQGVTFDILGVSVDAATGRTYVKYQIAVAEELRGKIYDFDIFAAKGNLVSLTPEIGVGGQSGYGSFMIDEEIPNYVAQVAPGENQVSIVICGYSREDWEDERVIEVNPDAEIYIRVDIPSESWTIVE